MGDYSPDWAITFEKGTVKHIYFIAETKGSMSSMQLRDSEKIKIKCANEFFNTMSKEDIVYKKIDGYDELMKLVKETQSPLITDSAKVNAKRCYH